MPLGRQVDQQDLVHGADVLEERNYIHWPNKRRLETHLQTSAVHAEDLDDLERRGGPIGTESSSRLDHSV